MTILMIIILMKFNTNGSSPVEGKVINNTASYYIDFNDSKFINIIYHLYLYFY